MAARRAASLQNGGDPHARGRRRQASEPRARSPGGRTHEDHQSHEGGPGPARHSRLQAGTAHGAAEADALRTPEETPIPPNTLDEMRRDMARLAWVREQINAIEQARLERLERAPATGRHAMVRMLARVIGVGVETADMLVQEVLSRNLRDRRAVARYAGLTGSPNESGSKRREQ